MKCLVFFILFVLFSQSVFSFPSGSPVCDVLIDYSNITGMTNRTRNPNSGDFILSADKTKYNTFEHLEITIKGENILGLMFTVVDSNGNKVGQFSPDTQVRGCDNQAMAITHTKQINSGSATLFWIPPSKQVGDIFILGYVLEGQSGNSASQQFYRFVREDGSALKLTPSEVIYKNGFEI